MRRLAVSALCLGLCSCESAGAGPPPVGVSVQPIEAGRVRLTYRGTSRMSASEVQDRALLQAAQYTLAQGFDWFQLASRAQGEAPPTSPQFSLGIGGASFGRGVGFGGGGATTFGGGGTLVVTLEVVLGHGAAPHAPDAYDARGVSGTLGSRYVR